jgi:hypothetical protein
MFLRNAHDFTARAMPALARPENIADFIKRETKGLGLTNEVASTLNSNKPCNLSALSGSGNSFNRS